MIRNGINNTKLNKMERKIVEETIGESLEINTDYVYGAKPFCINKLQDFLNKAKKNKATHIKITGSCWDGTLDDVDIEAIKTYKESDEDYAKRVAANIVKQENLKIKKEAEEKALYNELKLKYSD